MPRVQTTLLVPDWLLRRADDMMEPLRRHSLYAGVRFATRSDVLRLAITRGLTALEQDLDADDELWARRKP